MRYSNTFAAMYDHGMGKGIPLPRLWTGMKVSAAADGAQKARGLTRDNKTIASISAGTPLRRPGGP